jgi:hypothetical protein
MLNFKVSLVGTVGVSLVGTVGRSDQRFPEVARNETDFDHLLNPDLFLVRALIFNREFTATFFMVHFVFDFVIRHMLLPTRTSDPVGAEP